MIRICFIAAIVFLIQNVSAWAASVGNFQLTIIANGNPLAEVGSDVFLPTGAQYLLRLQNNNDIRASARITLGANVSQVVLLPNSQLDVETTFASKATFVAGADFEIRVEFRIPTDVRAWHWFEHWIESRQISLLDIDSTAVIKRPLPMVNGTAREEYLLSTNMQRADRVFLTSFGKDTTAVLTIVVRAILD